LTAEDLQAAAEKAGVYLSDEQISQILLECDVDGNGVVDATDVSQCMRGAWQRSEEVVLESKAGKRRMKEEKEAEIGVISARLLRNTEEGGLGEEEEPMSEEEQAAANQHIVRLRNEIEILDVEHQLPRTAEGPEKVHLMKRMQLLERYVDVYSKEDELAKCNEIIQATDPPDPKAKKAAKTPRDDEAARAALMDQRDGALARAAELNTELETDRKILEAMELEESIPTMEEGEEKTAAEERLQELQEQIGALDS